MKKMINLFKKPKTKGPIEYSDKIMRAVNDPSIRGLCINANYGYDWIDQKYCFLRLLFLRGQISIIKTGQDLLAHDVYLDALDRGRCKLSSYEDIIVIFENRTLPMRKNEIIPRSPKNCAYASPKRIANARKKFAEYFKTQAEKDTEFKKNLDSIIYNDILEFRKSKGN